ncbi:MAG: threonine synthase, partial [Saprospiraceae bacterium]|nr:threonine synthase [Saprospiraceae bacterium]
TLSNAMDVGAPSNFDRLLTLFDGDANALRQTIAGHATSDEKTLHTIRSVHDETGHLLDPHGATGYAALRAHLRSNETGLFLATAHPAKFLDTIKPLGLDVRIPERLARYRDADLLSVPMDNSYRTFRSFILDALG